eukprot:Filipodium_phascolosomae@DN7811_c0_g1_i1.p1
MISSGRRSIMRSTAHRSETPFQPHSQYRIRSQADGHSDKQTATLPNKQPEKQSANHTFRKPSISNSNSGNSAEQLRRKQISSHPLYSQHYPSHSQTLPGSQTSHDQDQGPPESHWDDVNFVKNDTSIIHDTTGCRATTATKNGSFERPSNRDRYLSKFNEETHREYGDADVIRNRTRPAEEPGRAHPKKSAREEGTLGGYNTLNEPAANYDSKGRSNQYSSASYRVTNAGPNITDVNKKPSTTNNGRASGNAPGGRWAQLAQTSPPQATDGKRMEGDVDLNISSVSCRSTGAILTARGKAVPFDEGIAGWEAEEESFGLTSRRSSSRGTFRSRSNCLSRTGVSIQHETGVSTKNN